MSEPDVKAVTQRVEVELAGGRGVLLRHLAAPPISPVRRARQLLGLPAGQVTI